VTREVVRLVVAAAVFFSTLGAYLAARHDTASTPDGSYAAAVPGIRALPNSSNVMYGDLAKGSICQDEIRDLPDHRPWRCIGLQPVRLLNGMAVAQAAHPDGRPCTHQRVETNSQVWTCWTRVPLPRMIAHPGHGGGIFVGDLRIGRGRPANAAGRPICEQEIRARPYSGTWSCISWVVVPPDGCRMLQPADPGGPCTRRDADVESGIWHCTRLVTSLVRLKTPS
jgi:hypothetical protein